MDWLPWHTSPNGVKTEIGFIREPGKRRKVVVKQQLTATMLNTVMDENEAMRNGHTIAASVRGNTQKHRVPIARLPEEIYWQLRRELGNPHTNPDAAKKWKAWMNNSDNRAFRLTEGNL